MKPIKSLIYATILFLCVALFIKSKTIKPVQKYEPYRKYEYIYSQQEIQAIEDSVKLANGIWK